MEAEAEVGELAEREVLYPANPGSIQRMTKIRYPAQQPRQTGSIMAHGTSRSNISWKGSWISIGPSNTWQEYHAEGVCKQTVFVFFSALSARHVLVIPVRIPYLAHAYASVASSLGKGLALWHAAWALFKLYPFLGIGRRTSSAEDRHVHGDVPTTRIIAGYEHAHGDYSTQPATTGVTGLLAYHPLVGVLGLEVWRNGVRRVSLREFNLEVQLIESE